MLIPFLIAVGVTCAITTGLALLTALAGATLGNYGRVTITINGRRTLEADGGRPLLAILKDEGIFVPSACGGRGSCGLCKLRVLDDPGAPAATEIPWLSPEERASGVRLSCQMKVKRPLRIEIPEHLFAVRQYTARVASLLDLTYDIKQVTLELETPDTLDFVAGQYIQLETPAYELTREPVYRAYSIASPPSRKKSIELEIRRVPRGICTTYVFEHLREGDSVSFNGPYGDFRLHESDRDIVCVAGGSGMAPIRSILMDMAEKGTARKTTYFFGARAARDLFLLDEMHDLERRLPAFRFIPALSAPEPGDAWTGETGLITAAIERLADSLAECEAYLCGSPLMIDACIKVLTAKGVPEDRIFYDKFA